MTTIRVRVASVTDRDFILGVVPRLRAFGPPPLRPTHALDRAEREAVEDALATTSDDAIVFVGEAAGAPAGVAYAQTAVDYFTRERHGHLAIIAVAEAGEGHGMGRALLAAVEQWASARGYRFPTLNVFAGNARARAVYERAGYTPDTIRYVKELEANGS